MGDIKKKKNNYVDTKELEMLWAKWNDDNNDMATWEDFQSKIYLICLGVARNFNPKNEEELNDLANETFVKTIEKIKSGRLTFDPGRAPVFNLLTTTISRHLLSLKTTEKRHRNLLDKYRIKKEYQFKYENSKR